MVYYKSVKIIIDTPRLVDIIIHMMLKDHSLLDSIVYNKTSLFILKFWSILHYFLGIKRKLSTAFYPQKDGQIKQQNSLIKAYLRAFVNFE